MAPWDTGFTVALSSNHAAASTPSSVTVPPGSQSAVFPITTSTVTTSTIATIKATAGGVTKTTSLTINPSSPPPPPPQTATLTVTTRGRNGTTITSTPAGISVSIPNTGSASFNIGTSITLRVSNNRDAIWSGACSSGGRKERTCVFTLNGNSTVTANVQ